MLKARAPQVEAGQTPAQSSVGWQVVAVKLLGALSKSAAHAIVSQVGRDIIRGVLGSIFGSSTTRRRR
jgi:hypothetical protein